MGNDIFAVVFLMRSGNHLLRDSLGRIGLVMPAHITEVPAAVIHPDADFLPLRKAQFSALQILLLHQSVTAQLGSDPLFLFHAGKLPRIGKKVARNLLHI